VKPERWRQVTDLFHAALERDDVTRRAFLDEQCRGDDPLRREVDAMLRAHTSAGRFGESALGTRAIDKPSLEPGATLGPYRVDGLIGAGGMGQVYRARDSRIGRDVAIKVLPATYAADADRLRRFEQEARASGALNHPNVLTLYDVGTAGGQPYLVTELLDGETLRDRINRGPLPPARACDWAAEIARGLAAAHAKEIVHRDLKPENIMVTREGRVKILDFGIAKLKARATTADGRTLTTPLHTAAEVMIGTAGYMAPEQVRGLPADGRADIFALGVIVFEMLTGRRAFDRPSRVETLSAILTDDPPAYGDEAASLPEGLVRIVRRCLEKDPDARFQSARDLAFALETIAALTLPREASVDRAIGRTRRSVGIGLVVVGIAVAALTIRAWRSTTPRAALPAQPLVQFAIPPPPRTTFSGRPAISPDGKLLVYSVDAGTGSNRLFFRRLDQLEATAIPGTEGGFEPFFSPDGQSVGFLDGSEIKKVSVAVAGASPVVVVAVKLCCMGATWAADNTIIFGSIEHGLHRVSADGGVPQLIAPLDTARHEIDHHFPRILPGDKAMLFTIHAGAERFRIGVQVLATGARKVLVEDGFDAQYSPTGHLVYSNRASLLAVPFDLDRLEVTGPPAKLLDGVATFPGDGEADYSLSPVGTLVFAPAPVRTGRRLVWLDRSGASTPLSIEPRVFAQPRLSPDGARLAVTVTEGERQNIWVHQFANGLFAPVTFDGVNRAPLWTPDGARLTYSSFRAGLQHLFWQPTDASAPAEPLLSSDNTLTPGGWTPDGRSLVFMEDPPTSNREIRSLTPHAPGRSELIPGIPIRSSWPALSPDGRWLAFVDRPAFSLPTVYVQPFPGPGLRRQIVDGGFEAIWSRDGRELFFRSRRTAAPNPADGGPPDEGIFAVPFDPVQGVATAQPVQLFRGRFVITDYAVPQYDVTRDGRRFVVAMAGDQEFVPVHLNVMLNVGDELLRRVPTAAARVR